MAERCGQDACGGVNKCRECRRIYQAERREKLRAEDIDTNLPEVDVNTPVHESPKPDIDSTPVRPDYVPEHVWAKLTVKERMKVHVRSPEAHAKAARTFTYLEQWPG